MEFTCRCPCGFSKTVRPKDVGSVKWCPACDGILIWDVKGIGHVDDPEIQDGEAEPGPDWEVFGTALDAPEPCGGGHVCVGA